MGAEKFPSTQAIRTFKKNKINFSLRPYKYVEKGGTGAAASELNVDEHMVIKTLVMEDEQRSPLLLLMHGDKEVSTKNLARVLGVKRVRPCDPDMAHRLTGYVVGGISPFGTRKRLTIYVEASIMDLPKIYINAGKRGMLAEMSPEALDKVLNPIRVTVAI